MPTSMRRRKHAKLTDPILMAVRAARVQRDEAEVEYAEACIAALNDGRSYRQVAAAAMIDQGGLHRYLNRFKDRQKRQSRYLPLPAKVD